MDIGAACGIVVVVAILAVAAWARIRRGRLEREGLTRLPSRGGGIKGEAFEGEGAPASPAGMPRADAPATIRPAGERTPAPAPARSAAPEETARENAGKDRRWRDFTRTFDAFCGKIEKGRKRSFVPDRLWPAFEKIREILRSELHEYEGKEYSRWNQCTISVRIPMSNLVRAKDKESVPKAEDLKGKYLAWIDVDLLVHTRKSGYPFFAVDIADNDEDRKKKNCDVKRQLLEHAGIGFFVVGEKLSGLEGKIKEFFRTADREQGKIGDESDACNQFYDAPISDGDENSHDFQRRMGNELVPGMGILAKDCILTEKEKKFFKDKLLYEIWRSKDNILSSVKPRLEVFLPYVDTDDGKDVRKMLRRLHVDFAVYHEKNEKFHYANPICAIELDDPSHGSGDPEAEARDRIKDMLFKHIGVPLVRVETDEEGRLKDGNRFSSDVKAAIDAFFQPRRG